jgi:hypothetical protein
MDVEFEPRVAWSLKLNASANVGPQGVLCPSIIPWHLPCNWGKSRRVQAKLTPRIVNRLASISVPKPVRSHAKCGLPEAGKEINVLAWALDGGPSPCSGRFNTRFRLITNILREARYERVACIQCALDTVCLKNTLMNLCIMQNACNFLTSWRLQASQGLCPWIQSHCQYTVNITTEVNGTWMWLYLGNWFLQ